MQVSPTVERLPLLDALRGFALCGILLANLLAFTGAVYITMDELHHASGLTRAILFAIDFFIEGKFYTLFSILFGIGCALQWQRHAEHPRRFLPLWYRRMAALVLIGLLHMYLIWHGDILTLYALLGLLLPLLIKLERKPMLYLVLALLVLPLCIYAIRFSTTTSAFWQLSANTVIRLREAWGIGGIEPTALLTSDNAFTVLLTNVTNALQRPMSYLQTGRIFQVLGQFLLGFWFGRYLLPRFQQGWRPQKHSIIFLIAVAISSNLIYACIKNIYASPFLLSPIGALQSFAYHIGSTSMALCYIIAIDRCWQLDLSKRSLMPLVYLGRMSLSNYLSQSLIGITLFYGYGFGLMGQIPFSTIPLIAFFILWFQWQFSKRWLNKFPHGPIETLWRGFTYARSKQLPVDAKQP